MEGPLLLGIVGAVIVVASVAINWVLITPDRPRYGLDKENAFNGGTNIRQLIADWSRLTGVALVGSVFQLVAVIWQASRGG